MSLPFIPMICSRLNSRHLLVAGLSVAIMGYVIATYLGVGVAFVLK